MAKGRLYKRLSRSKFVRGAGLVGLGVLLAVAAPPIYRGAEYVFSSPEERMAMRAAQQSL